MDNPKRESQCTRFIPFITVAVLTITALLTVLKQVEGSSPSPPSVPISLRHFE
jgi:hypothetical protein